ncbi:SsrA-binding protein SmpB [Aerococcus sanguinicola]|uniref:SsrA-binding protein SmpB n=1 Tax=unclassified Aerococcus TaxID=2618060 RepID=UPI0008A1F14C|nr:MULTISPECIES: SsrA-binding protein SmpB [unclassified Aerococcus]MDK6233552.1 SsrA-binding protein SmpB [Aerococcus sp. UMB10185]MDK6856109.1 SsrA-binding protein SmpB [Aerococcus sp. UMB7533]MDK8501518.1 SsrA-binding protein SmpB [Aerococcus sp. UMB1112A]OFN01314.1 SsrA-binding protein [Aerococcus sp. HMSC062A02]OHO46253.1 SsrA-binding protein [Aerococcus sp. HMSC035B07]
MAKAKDNSHVVARNRKANHDFTIEDTIECGIVLTGTEIKSVRQSKVNLKDAFARIERGEVWLYQCHISPYEQGNRYNPDPMRRRKLLLKKREIAKLEKATERDGYTLVALKMYIKRGFAKVLIGTAKGKKRYDKRQSLKERDMKRDIQRALKVR